MAEDKAQPEAGDKRAREDVEVLFIKILMSKRQFWLQSRQIWHFCVLKKLDG
jgi:hypothetical protein